MVSLVASTITEGFLFSTDPNYYESGYYRVKISFFNRGSDDKFRSVVLNLRDSIVLSCFKGDFYFFKEAVSNLGCEVEGPGMSR